MSSLHHWLRQNGYLALKNADAKEGGELFQDVDWQKTKAYSLGFGGVYINQSGREVKGIVEPGPESAELKSELAAKLADWMDEGKGKAVVTKVYHRDEVVRGPLADQAPDLYIGFAEGYRASWQTAIGACPEPLIEDNLKKWSGDHLVDPALVPGVLLMNRSISLDIPSIYDIAPTILKAVGYTEDEMAPMDLDGHPLY